MQCGPNFVRSNAESKVKTPINILKFTFMKTTEKSSPKGKAMEHNTSHTSKTHHSSDNTCQDKKGSGCGTKK